MLYWTPGIQELRIAIRQHLHALDSPGRNRVIYHNAAHGFPLWLRHAQPDLVVLHTTFLCMRWSHLFPSLKSHLGWLSELGCPKVALPQDEYDHAEILDEWLFELGVSYVFSNFDSERRSLLYPLMSDRAIFRHAFTGYIDDQAAHELAARMKSPSERKSDIVYRASHLPYWFGRQGQLKHQIADVFGVRARALGMRSDISTRLEDTIVGDRWLDFLMSGRAVIGCESGSSVLDRRGEIRARIQHLLRIDPELSFEEVNSRMPKGWDDYSFVALSPRHFEAIITRTCQVLIEGQYDGVLQSSRHYIPVRRDLSNVDDALAQVSDPELVEEITDRAYQEIYVGGRYTYNELAREIDAILEALPRRHPFLRRIVDPLVWSGTHRGFQVISHVWQLPSVELPRIVIRRPRIPEPVAWVKAAAALSVTLREGSFRRLLFDWLRDGQLRRTIGLGSLLRDLHRLSVLRRVRKGLQTPADAPFRISLWVDADAREIRFESRPGRASADWASSANMSEILTSGDPLTLVWDHSAVGRGFRYEVVRLWTLQLALGERGLYFFSALSELARLRPALVANALDETDQDNRSASAGSSERTNRA